MKATIIGTGLTSMVGSRFVELFQDEYYFTNLDLATGIDITNEEDTKQKIEGGESGGVVLHFAAFTDVDAANDQADDKDGLCYRLNVLGTRYVAQSCKAAGKYLIHISTDFVFDGTKTSPYTESDSPNPIEWYGQTKFWAEHEVEKSGVAGVIVRTTYPYRAHFEPKKDFVRNIIAKLKDGTLPPMFTDHIITPTFIDDIAHALKVISEKKPQGIYHVVGSSYESNYDVATKVAKIFGLDKSRIKPGSLEEFLKTAKRPYQKSLATSNAKLKRDLGVSMSTLEEGLYKMREQQQENPR
ncbi:MAG: NAD(P)-dependent oxidoreductase [Candidatus Chisholmbacteria bacterium]|nr:NAD(P)-dependent oxidoreductase [Candidatus Chisholmbacteria bacterium]